LRRGAIFEALRTTSAVVAAGWNPPAQIARKISAGLLKNAKRRPPKRARPPAAHPGIEILPGNGQDR
jgi:hypothetical protein